MRLFVAIELGEAVKNGLTNLQTKLARACDGVRWIPREQLHLTVKFIGDVPDPEVHQLSASIATATTQVGPFSMTLSGCGCFPPRGGVRIVWAACHDPTGVLTHAVELIENELEQHGCPREQKPFSPHITIGRVKEDHSAGRIRAAVEAATLNPLEQPVQSVTLMSSVLSPKGPTYAAVSRSKLSLES